MSVDINNNPKTKKASSNSGGIKESTPKIKAQEVVEENTLPEKVAIHSPKNINWSEVGELVKGYNIVTREAAEKWLARGSVRLATPQEVAKEYGL